MTLPHKGRWPLEAQPVLIVTSHGQPAVDAAPASGAVKKMTLYSADWCWYCKRVVDKLAELGVDYEYVEVPVFHSKRADVLAVSGQTSVPVLVDGDVVLDDDDTIIPYLEEKYGKPL